MKVCGSGKALIQKDIKNNIFIVIYFKIVDNTLGFKYYYERRNYV